MTILTLQPDPLFAKDTYITATATQSWNYGVATTLWTGGAPSAYKTLLQFAVENIPPGATINSATLSLVLVSANNLSTTLSVEVRRALTDWNEGNANAALPTNNGASWTNRDQNVGIPWASSTAGGLAGTDYSNTAAATTSVTGTGTYTWDLTSEVNAMVNGGVVNRGWWLIQPSGGNKTFVSSEDSGRPSDWPKLVIDYTPAADLALVLQPDATAGIDTSLRGNGALVSNNYGISTSLNVGNDGAWNKSLIKFDLSSLPAGAVVVSAKMILHNVTAPSTPPSIGAFRSLVQWFEGNQNGAAPPGGVDGSTWNAKNANGSVAWGAVGGQSGTDYATTATDSQTVSGPFDYTWDVTTDVQGFQNGSLTNNGWWLVTPNVVNTACIFSSSDSTFGHQRPRLVVVYTLGLLVAAVAGTSTVTGIMTTVNPVVTIQPDASAGNDTTIREFSPTFNYGLATTISVGWDSSSSKKRRGLIKFDLSSIPAGSHIINATLKLFCTSEVVTTDFTVSAYRSLVAWFEGNQNGAAPSGGNDGSTWNSRNVNGSLPWSGGIGGTGGTSGGDYSASPTASASITTTGQFFNWDVSVDVQNFVSGLQSNLGWWLIGNTESGAATSLKDFASSDSGTPAQRPVLLVVYRDSMAGVTAGTSTTVGLMVGVAGLEGSIAGTSSHFAQMITNFFSVGHIAGTSTATGILFGGGNLHGNSFGDSTSIGHIRAEYHSVGHGVGTSFAVAHLKGKFNLLGVTAGAGFATAHIFTKGQIQGAAFGTSTAVASAYARAVNVAAVIGCNPVPLFHITNGSVKPNGQLNILNFLGDRAGYFLVNYKPQIAQYKDQGYWSSSPQSQGRRLRGKVFDNVIDTIEVSARAGSQDALIQYQQDLLDFQEAASDYWANDYSFLPYFLVARAARETNTRYAIVHMISCPELENPYTQPFFDDSVGATFVSLTIHIEHGLWTSTPPGRFDCVEVSGQREWTVSGWQGGT